MFAPTSANARAIDPNARAVIGRPSTTTTCVECLRAAGSSDIPSEVCTCMAMLAIACSTASCRPSGSWCAATSTPSVSRPRMTTCSTSSRSTPCRVSAAKRTELTPGRSGPVTVMRTVVVPGTR